MTETKPTNGLLTDRLNGTDQKTDNLTNNRRIETHQRLMTNFTRVFQPIPSWLNWPITFNGQLYNIFDWQILFTWWLPLRLSKRQSPTTVLFRTTLTQTITQYELLIFLTGFKPFTIENSYIHSIVLDSLLIPVEDLPIVRPFFRIPQTFEVGEIFFLCLKISSWMIF